MKNLPLLLLFLLLLPATAAGQRAAPLPRPIRAALDQEFPGWRFSEVSAGVREFFRESLPGARPNLVTGDFDGDGRADYALLIEHSNFDQPGAGFSHVVERLVFLRRGAGYRMHRLEQDSPANPDLYLTLARRGRQGFDFKAERKYRYPNDSISVWYFEKAGGTYIYQRGRFRYVTEAD